MSRAPARAVVLAAWLCLGGAGAAQAPPPASELTVAEAISRAVSANPAVAAARMQRAVDRAGVAVAGERPNPELLYESSRETPRQALGLTLPIELGGKRQRRIDLAAATAAVGDADVARVVADLSREVRRIYFEAVAAQARLQIAGDVRALAQRARDAAQARVVAGDAPRSDLTLSELALATSENEMAGTRGEVAATLAELNTVMGQAAGTPLVLTDALGGGPLPASHDASALAAASNAEVQVLDRRLAEQAARVNLAKAMTVPDVTVGSTLTYDAEPEFRVGWRMSGGVTLPLFTGHHAGVVVEEATLARLRQEREALVARIGGSLAAAISRATAARDQIERYDTVILPLARQAERQAQAAYDGGQVGLPALVQAIQTARETRQRGLQAGLDYQHALTDLEQAVGAPIK